MTQPTNISGQAGSSAAAAAAAASRTSTAEAPVRTDITRAPGASVASGAKPRLTRFTAHARRAVAAVAHPRTYISARVSKDNVALGGPAHADVLLALNDTIHVGLSDSRRTRLKQDDALAREQLDASATPLPASAKNEVFAIYPSDWGIINEPDGVHTRKLVMFEMGSSGAAGTLTMAESAQVVLQSAAVRCGKLLGGMGPQALALVVTSGSGSVEGETKAKLIDDPKTTPYERHYAQTYSRKAPNKFGTAEKLFVTMSGMADALRAKFGRNGFDLHTLDPATFKSNVVTSKDSRWTTNTKPAVVGLHMADGMQYEGFELRNIDENGKSELYMHGRKVNLIYNDGFIGQLEAALQGRIDPARCKLVNPTSHLGTNKHACYRAYNDFMAEHGKKYPIFVQHIESHEEKEVDAIVDAVMGMLERGIPAIIKADGSRQGTGIAIFKDLKATREEVEKRVIESRQECDAKINDASGKKVAGNSYTITQFYPLNKLTFPEGDERHEMVDWRPEPRFCVMTDFSRKYAHLPGRGVMKSCLALTKLAGPNSDVGNVSAQGDAYKTVLPTNAASLAVMGLSKAELKQAAKGTAHFGAWLAENWQRYEPAA